MKVTRQARASQWYCCAALLIGFLVALSSLAHEGHDDLPGLPDAPPVDMKADPLCGPKSLYAVCQLLGYEATLDDFVEATQPTEQGTSLLALFDAAESRGMKVSAHRFQSVDDLRGLSALVVAYVNRNHFFVIEGVFGEFVRVVDHDPFSSGLISVSEFDEMWEGECLVIERPERLGRTSAIVVDQPTYDFGDRPAGSTLTQAFTFRNEGELPLVITGSSSSCDCTSVVTSGTEIPPGGEGSVSMSRHVDAETRGTINMSLVMATNDPARPRVIVSATANIVGGIAVKPDRLYIGSVTVGQAVEKQIVLHPNDYPFDVVDVSTSSPDVAYLAADTQPDQTVLSFQVTPSAASEPYDQVITIDVHGRDDAPTHRSQIVVRVEGEVHEDVEVYPTRFFFGLVTATEHRASTVQVTNNTDAPLDIVAIESPLPYIRAEVIEAPQFQGHAQRVRAHVLAGAPSGRLETEITLRTNHPTHPVLVIPVFGVVE